MNHETQNLASAYLGTLQSIPCGCRGCLLGADDEDTGHVVPYGSESRRQWRVHQVHEDASKCLDECELVEPMSQREGVVHVVIYCQLSVLETRSSPSGERGSHASIAGMSRGTSIGCPGCYATEWAGDLVRKEASQGESVVHIRVCRQLMHQAVQLTKRRKGEPRIQGHSVHCRRRGRCFGPELLGVHEVQGWSGFCEVVCVQRLRRRMRCLRLR